MARISLSGRLLGLLLVISVCGGSGSPAVLVESGVVLATLVLVAIAIIRGVPLRPATSLGITALALALPFIGLLQLVPLPAAWWQSLPGREALQAGLAAVGSGDVAWPISLVPERTLAALLSMVPPLLAFCLSSRLSQYERRKLLPAIVTLGVVSASVACLQGISGDDYYLYTRSIDAFPSGIFANHNAQGDCLLIGLCACLMMWSGRVKPAGRLALGAAMALLLLAVMLSGSRTSILLLVVPVVLAIRLTPGKAAAGPMLQFGRRVVPLILIGAVLLGVAVASNNALFSRAAQRFGARDDPRLSRLWPDSIYAARSFLPVGVGLGAFPQAFEQVERLEILAPGYPNRAHMDYLELVIETGVAGLAVLVAALVALVMRARAALRKDSRYWADEAGPLGWAIICIIGAHSMVDYPLRAMTLAILFALGCGLLFGRTRGRLIDVGTG